MSHPPSTDADQLLQQHTPTAIADRLAAVSSQSALGDFVLGAVDGTVTTFAIVSGAAGAGMSSGVAIVLGLANVFADGFSMAASNYLKAKSDHEIVERFRQMEERHIDQIPSGEREEIRQIYAAKGFQGASLEEAVTIITRDRKRWVDTMLAEEWGLHLYPMAPGRAAMSTFVAFLLAGMIPLMPLFFLPAERAFLASTIATALTFIFIGMARGKVAQQSVWRGGLETLLVGGTAAAIAYGVGLLLKAFSVDAPL